MADQAQSLIIRYGSHSLHWQILEKITQENCKAGGMWLEGHAFDSTVAVSKM